MTIIKKKTKKKNFSIIDNGGILDSALSWKATGLWVWLMSKPDDWEVNIENLCHSKLDGRDSVLSALSELEDADYLVYQRQRNSTGQFESSYTVFESPEQLEEWRQGASPEELCCIAKVSKNKGRKRTTTEKPLRVIHDGKTTVDNPQWVNRSGSTAVENPCQLNIDKQKTDQPNIELLKTDSLIPPSPPVGGEETDDRLDGGIGSWRANPLTRQSGSEEESATIPNNHKAGLMTDSQKNKEIIAACDNNVIVDTNSGAYKMEQKLKARSTLTYANYRNGAGKNGIKSEFLNWLCSSYLPKTEYYRGQEVDLSQAKGWVLNKEHAGQQELVEVRYEEMLAKQQLQQTQQQKHATLTPDQEAWLAIACEIETVSEGACVNITQHRGLWRLTSNISGLSGLLDDVMKAIPLTALPSRFKTWYPECHRRAKRKSPDLILPAPLSSDK